MSQIIHVIAIFVIHVFFVIKYLISNLDHQNYLGQEITFLFDEFYIIKILIISTTTIFLIYLPRLFFKFKNFKEINNNLANEKFLINCLLFLFSFFLIIFISNSNFEYKYISAERSEYSLLFESRIFLYLFVIRQFFLNDNKLIKSTKYLCYLISFLVLFSQFRSIIFEIFLIFICLNSKKNFDKIQFKYIFLIIFLIPISNIYVMIRQSMDIFDNLSNLFDIEYLIIFNNKLAASIYLANEYSFEYKFNWLIERLSLIIPGIIRNYLSIKNPNNDLFLDISTIAKNLSGGQSYLGHLYLIFENYMFIILFIFFSFLEKLRRNFFYNENKSNFLNYAYPLILSYFILALRNDLGVLLKQIIQTIILCILLNALFKRTKSNN